MSDGDIEKWNEGKIPLLLAHPQSAGHGLNLQKGGHIIVWFGLTWSLEFYQQANARLDRQGQTQPVIIHHLVTKGTIDEQVIKALQAKEQGQSALMAAVKAKIEEYRGINLDKLISFWLCLGLAMMIYKVSEWIISILARIPYDVRFILLSALLTLILYKNVQVTVNSESDEQEGR